MYLLFLRAYCKTVIVVVCRKFIDKVLLGNVDGQSYGFRLPFLVICRGIIRAPASSRTLLVGEFRGAFHIDDTCRERVDNVVVAEEHIDVGVAMTGILRVADDHVHRFRQRIFLPAFIDDLHNGAQRPIADDSLCAALHRLNHRGFQSLGVEAAQGAESESIPYPQHIVAIARCLLLVAGVELRLLQLQSLLELSIEVERLPFVEVDADAIQLALEAHAVMVQQVVAVGAVAACGDALHIIILLVFLFHFVIAHHHLGIDAGRVGGNGTTERFIYIEDFLLFRPQINEEAQLVEMSILIEVV